MPACNLQSGGFLKNKPMLTGGCAVLWHSIYGKLQNKTANET